VNLNADKGIALFTDGSSYYEDETGGWAWVAIDCYEGLETGSGAASGTTNNRMEMQAWIEGLNAMAESLGPCQVLVYCDSEIVGRGFSGVYARKKNTDLWELLQEAADQHEYVEWVWVKGHKDSLYNDMADELAGRARRTLYE
jgi:ribonuclease HI